MSDLANSENHSFASVGRPASIELRFSSLAKCEEAVKFYLSKLGLGAVPNPISLPFSMNVHDDQELVFIVATTDTDCSVIYWELPATADIDSVYDDLNSNHGCTGKKRPHRRPNLPHDKPNTKRSLQKSSDGNLFGLIINPPYP